MNPVIHKERSLAIAYDASLMDVPGVEYFSSDYWASQQKVTGEAIGRGSAWYINTPVGPVVLRKYLRGGWVAKISRQSYFFTAVSRSRPIKEFLLLAGLYDMGLPVPRPVSALCEYHGIFSTGSIMTACIPRVRTLAELLPANNTSDENLINIWPRVGKCIREFHNAGVWHADLNARNILIDDQSRVFLIDFDQARFTPGKIVNGEGNLSRLKRSLEKLWPPGDLSAMHKAWSRLKAAYDS